jgi:hypothetical protein
VNEIRDKDFASEGEGIICMIADVSADKVRLLAIAMCSERIIVVYDYKDVCIVPKFTCIYNICKYSHTM